MLAILLQICMVLSHLAGVGVAHRDLKLDNITIAASEGALEDEIRVIDFGCAVVTDDLVIDIQDESTSANTSPSSTSSTLGSKVVEEDKLDAIDLSDTHGKFLKKRRRSSLLVGNQKNWAPELWNLAKLNQNVSLSAPLHLSLHCF